MWPIILILLAGLFYVLYRSGYLCVKSIGALTFVGSFYGKDRCSASFTSCTGSVRRIIKLPGSGNYDFHFQSDLQKGSVEILVLNRAGQPLLVLNGTSSMTIPGGRYTLVMRFRAASGSLNLRWNPIH